MCTTDLQLCSVKCLSQRRNQREVRSDHTDFMSEVGRFPSPCMQVLSGSQLREIAPASHMRSLKLR